MKQQKKENFGSVVRELVKLRKLNDVSFDVFVVSNKEMDEIKERLTELPQFRGVEAEKIKGEKEVNVLAFPADPLFPGPKGVKKLLGEVYLNRDWAKDDREKLTTLLIHGFLHLLGYRHRAKNDRIKMEREEKKLLWHLNS